MSSAYLISVKKVTKEESSGDLGRTGGPYKVNRVKDAKANFKVGLFSQGSFFVILIVP